jgi:site-specific DNA-methyltransferase (adenine-specific)
LAEVVVLGSVAADVVLEVKSIPAAGGHVDGDMVGWRPGGSSANIACALASAGHAVELVGVLGADELGDLLIETLKSHRVGTSHITRVASPAARTLILIDENGERTIIGLRSVAQDNLLYRPAVPTLDSADAVFVESYSGFSPAVVKVAPTALLAANLPPTDAALWPADLLIGSNLQLPGPWRSKPFEAARVVAGPRLRWVVVTSGRQGATAHGQHEAVHVPSPPARQADATGAGDAFAAGVLHGFLTGHDLHAAMEGGAMWGAAAVERMESIPPNWQDLIDLPAGRPDHEQIERRSSGSQRGRALKRVTRTTTARP